MSHTIEPSPCIMSLINALDEAKATVWRNVAMEVHMSWGYKRWQQVMVYKDPGVWKQPEGLAVLMKHHPTRDRAGMEYWTVEFIRARETLVERWIRRRRGEAVAG